MFDANIDNKKAVDEFLTQVASIKNNKTTQLISKFLKVFEESSEVFNIVVNCSDCGSFFRITLRIRHTATGRYFIVEHDRYVNGVNKSKTSWVTNEPWLKIYGHLKSEFDKPAMAFSKTSFDDVVKFVNSLDKK